MKKSITLASIVLALAFILTACGSPAGSAPSASAYRNPATLSGDTQTVTTQFSARAYSQITVQVGVPVVWTINMPEKDLNSCNNEMMIPEYNVTQKLAVGENTVTFTPTKTGTVPYSCWMGMIRSKIIVVDNLSSASASVTPATDAANTTVNQAANAPIGKPAQAAPKYAVATLQDGKQTVNLAVTRYGYDTALVIVQKDIPTDFSFTIESPSCGIDVVFPQMSGYTDLSETSVVTVTPTEDFIIWCTMLMYGIQVKVVEDINGAEVDQLIQDMQNNPNNYVVQGEGCCGGPSCRM